MIERIEEKINTREILSSAWGLAGAFSATFIADKAGLGDISSAFTVITLFLISYILADEFVRRSCF